MDNYSKNDKPYIYTAFPDKYEHTVLNILAPLCDEGVSFCHAKGFSKAEMSRIKRAFGVLLFVDNELLRSKFFSSIVDYATRCNQKILCVFMEKADITPWSSMQLGSQRALFFEGSTEKLSASLKEGYIFKDMEVTAEQKNAQKKRAFITAAVPLLSAAVLFFTVINPLLVEPLQEKTRFIEQYGITTDDLSKIEELHIIGDKNFDTYVHAWYEDDGKTLVAYDMYVNGIMEHQQEKLAAGSMTTEDLEIVKYMPNLTTLEIEGQQITDISPLFDTNIENIRLNCNPLTSIEGIEKMTSLRELILDDTDIADISPAFKLENLEMLQFDNTYVSDLSGIENMKSLNTLMFCNTKVKTVPKLGELEHFTLDLRQQRIYDMSFIENVKSFASIQIDSMGDCMRPKDIMPYIEGKPIEKIAWCGVEKIEDIYGLNIVDGGNLGLPNSYLTSLEGIENFEGIGTLELFHHQGDAVTFTDLSPVLNLKSLNCLILSPDMEDMAKQQLEGATFEIVYNWG